MRKFGRSSFWERAGGTLRLPKWLGLCLILSSIVFSTVAFAQQAQQTASQATVANLRVAPATYPGTVHLLPATLETTQWGWFDNSQPPVMKIPSGDTVVVETMMHSHNQIVPGTTIETIKKLRTDYPGRGPHTITGPIYVADAEPGDVLQIKILKILPRSYATNFNVPGLFGAFPKQFPDGQVKYFYLDMDRKVAEFAPGIEIPLAPFPGVIGVARAEPGKYSTVPPGPYGGNLDIQDMVAGTTLYLPVFVKGALLWTGDSHAAQGNGEINLTAMETAFKEIVLNISVIKGKKLNWPQIETPLDWITVGIDKDLDKALDIAQAETTQFLAEQRHINPTEAAALMAQVSDCRISQIVDVNQGIHCLNPKNVQTKRTTEYPTADTLQYYVTTAKTNHAQIDLDKAMKDASMAMINSLQQKQKMTRLDAYALASMTMDCRLNIATEEKSVHCLVPKRIWLANR